MSRSRARFLPTLLTLVTIVFAGLTAASVHRLISLDPASLESARDIATHRVIVLGSILFAALALLVVSLIAAERNARNLLRLARTARAEADRARAQLVEAVENISEGFVLYDKDDRLVLCNRKFREAYKVVADVLKPGVTSEEILRAATDRGQFPQAVDKETWIANRLAQRRRFDPPFEQQLAGGRWHMVADRPTRDGGLVGIRTDITELKRRELELREARENLEKQADRTRALADEAQQTKAVLQDAIESVNEGFCLYDRDDRLVMCNSRFLDLHEAIRDAIAPGVAFAEITRLAIEKGAMIAHEPTQDALERRRAIRRDLVDASFEEEFAGERWVRVSTRRTRNGGVVSVYADITEIKQREFALTSAHTALERQTKEMSSLADAAQRANRAKSEFLAMMSHEIRTPLNGVISALQLLRGEKLDAQDGQLVATARTGASALLGVLNDILDMSKIEAGMLELDNRAFDPRELVDGVVSLCRVQAEGKGLTLSATIAETTPRFVAGDPGRVRQMILNYVTNAIKFTEQGGVELHVVRARDDKLRFEVVDTGIGIPFDKQGQVFRDFTQLDQSIRRRHGGTGLGLAITRRLARLMGGAIGFASAPDRGSTFWFEVPLPAAEAPAREDAREDLVSPLADHAIALKVLLAEDNDTNRFLATLLLQRMGCTVTAVADGAAAVEAATKDAFDAIFMDISMPVMDGLEASRRVRAAGVETPIVALSANTGPEFEGECRAAGMFACLAKPIDLAALRCVMASIGNARDEAAPPAAPLFERDVLDRLHDELGPKGFARITAICEKDIAVELEALVAAWKRAPAGVRDENMRRAAHKLVSLAATIGANELARLSRVIEAGGEANRDAYERIAHESLQMLRARVGDFAAIAERAA